MDWIFTLTPGFFINWMIKIFGWKNKSKLEAKHKTNSRIKNLQDLEKQETCSEPLEARISIIPFIMPFWEHHFFSNYNWDIESQEQKDRLNKLFDADNLTYIHLKNCGERIVRNIIIKVPFNKLILELNETYRPKRIVECNEDELIIINQLSQNHSANFLLWGMGGPIISDLIKVSHDDGIAKYSINTAY